MEGKYRFTFVLPFYKTDKGTVIDSLLLHWFSHFFLALRDNRYRFNFLTLIIIYAKIFSAKYKYESVPRIPFSQRRSLDRAAQIV
jgi:hypothetical protein